MLAPFAMGKSAQRVLAQSLAREYGPKGVHVAHAIIDGMIDIPSSAEMLKGKGENEKISPETVSALSETLFERDSCLINVSIQIFVYSTL